MNGLYCGFCHRGASDVEHIIQGLSACICDECVRDSLRYSIIESLLNVTHTMEVVEDDIIQRGYRLTGEASQRFVMGGFTHLRCDGVTTATRVVGGVVYIGDEVIL